jgi:hypothetical protein
LGPEREYDTRHTTTAAILSRTARLILSVGQQALPIPSAAYIHRGRLLAGTVLVAGAVVVLARRLGVGADIDEGGLVAVGFGDADNLTSVAGRDSLDINLAGAFGALKTHQSIPFWLTLVLDQELTVPHER